MLNLEIVLSLKGQNNYLWILSDFWNIEATLQIRKTCLLNADAEGGIWFLGIDIGQINDIGWSIEINERCWRRSGWRRRKKRMRRKVINVQPQKVINVQSQKRYMVSSLLCLTSFRTHVTAGASSLTISTDSDVGCNWKSWPSKMTLENQQNDSKQLTWPT